MEVNDHPSMYIYHETDYMGGGGEKILSEVDLFVKKKSMGDAIALSRNPSADSYKSYLKIYRSDINDE